MALADLGVELDGDAVAGEGQGGLADAEGVEQLKHLGGGGGFQGVEGGEAGALEPCKRTAMRCNRINTNNIERKKAEVELVLQPLTAEGGGAGVAGGGLAGVGGGKRHGLAADLDAAHGGAGEVEQRTSAEGSVGAVAAAAQMRVAKPAVQVHQVHAYAIGFELDGVGAGVALQPVVRVGVAVEAKQRRERGQGVGREAGQAIEGAVGHKGDASAVGGVGQADKGCKHWC